MIARFGIGTQTRIGRAITLVGGLSALIPPSVAQEFQPRVALDLRLVPLIEAVPEAAMRRAADPDDRDGDGISGRLHDSFSPHLHAPGVGRYGWKATAVTLEDQVLAGIHAGDGRIVVGPEITAFAAKLRALDVPSAPTPPPVLFEQAECDACHRPNGGLFSNLLLHDVGVGLADNRAQGFATAAEWRTAPLRFLRGRRCFLHDCRATSVQDAILRHGGEAARSIDVFTGAESARKAALIAWLTAME